MSFTSHHQPFQGTLTLFSILSTVFLTVSNTSNGEVTSMKNIQTSFPYGNITHPLSPKTSILQEDGCGPSNILCGAGATCSAKEGRCVCVDSEDMTFDDEGQTSSCSSFVGTACFLEPIVGVMKQCVENAHCLPDNPLTGYCVCDEGFDPNPDRLCGSATLRPTVSTSIASSIPTNGPTTTRPTTAEPEVPGTHPPGIVGQPCNIPMGRDCIQNAVCTDGYCVCGQAFVHKEDFKSCISSSNPSLTKNNFYQLFVISVISSILI